MNDTPGWVTEETPDLYGAYPRLEDYQIVALTAVGQRRRFVKGQTLQRAGEPADEFLVVLEGRVLVLQDNGSAPHVIGVHGARRFLGDLGLLTGQPSFLTSVTEDAGQLLAIPVEKLREVVSRDAGLADLMLRAFLVRRSLQLTLGAGFAIIGSRYSADTRRLRDFAARNRLPHQWIDLENDTDAERLLRELGVDRAQTPVVLWRGEVLRNPDNEQLAELVGLRPASPPRSVCDLIVVGAGPAGLAAAVYGASEGLATVVVDSVATGGQAGTSSRIENYLGFPTGISGSELADRAVVQCKRFGAELVVPAGACGLGHQDGQHVVRLEGGEKVCGRAVVIASGVHYRRLELSGLETVEPTSVYYAATEFEANLCQGDPVVVVGGGNSAGQAAVFLSQYAGQVTLVVRSNDLGRDMSRYLADRIEGIDRIRVLVHSEARAVRGQGVLEEVVAEDLGSGERHSLPAKALFVFIGSVPHVRWLGQQIELDDHGYVRTGPQLGPGCRLLETSRPGIFAAGDIRSGSVKRVAAAVGDGALAVRLVHEYLAGS
ncbi:FAD-dependent oxidoreductase [Kribbella sp. NPDC051770]|uniref:FAD-dependent oxidoreductase n=1 Tax=Kribbella sp. NPDC051770 TaxID=3155413 RepID=UPI00344075BB